MELEIIINKHEGKNVVSSRVVAEQLNKEHSDVMRKCREVLGVGEFSESSYINSQNKTQPELLLTKDGFILLCMNYQGYNDFKRAYINKFYEMENELKLSAPKTLKEALMLALQQQEQIELLEEQNNKLEHKVVHQTDVITSLVDDVRIKDMRQYLNEIIRMKPYQIKERYGLLYKEYSTHCHINLNARVEAYNLTHNKKINKLQYIDEITNDIPTLYRIAVKIFESDFKNNLQKYIDLL